MNDTPLTFSEPSFTLPPQRIVSLVPSTTESLFDLNLGGRVIAVTNYCIHPADKVAGLPKVGGVKTPEVSKIIALQPDIVLMDVEENRLEDARALHEADIPVWAVHNRTVADAINYLWDLMRVFDEPGMSDRVRWIERQLDWAAAATQHQAPISVFAPIWYKPWMTMRGDTCTSDLLRLCGGRNVFADHPTDKAYFAIQTEDIVAQQPEVVLLPDDPFVFMEQHVIELQQMDIPAAQSGRIHRIDGTLLVWHGTRLAMGINAISQLLHEPEELTRG